MVDVWQPANTLPAGPDLTLVEKLAALSAELEQHDDLNQFLSADDLAAARSWIQLSEAQWLPVIKQLEAESRLKLALFYTLAEVKLNGWQAGDKNPAIWIFRFLKQTHQLPEKNFIRLLKSKTDNRFIPYGSVL